MRPLTGVHAWSATHVTPFPTYPGLHPHTPPVPHAALLPQLPQLATVRTTPQLSVALSAPQLRPAREQREASLSPVHEHVMPSPLQPLLQAQVREPAVLPQVAFASHPPFAVAHSLMSTQVPFWSV
jgi:hypothetical protein